mmetsp:Transcript_40285/g.92630  ORF Transcript_40285/g.92630 Transcript_40285/m.92630 type:complete len:334 (-) Transcript_40285:41-1042(-)
MELPNFSLLHTSDVTFANAIVPGGNFAQALCRSFTGAIFDKSFFLVAALAAWDPVEGLRAYKGAAWDRLVVLAAACLALSMRVFLVAAGSEAAQWGAAIFEGLATVVCIALAMKVRTDLSNTEFAGSQGLIPKPTGGAVSNDETWATDGLRKQSDGPWLSDAFRQPWVPNPFAESAEEQDRENPEASGGGTYGSTESPAVLKEDKWRQVIRLVVNGSLTLGTVFIMDAEDKLDLTLLDGGHTGSSFTLGAILGLALAVSLAVFLGFAFERQVLPTRLLFAISLLFFSLGFVSMSQAITHTIAVTGTGALLSARQTRVLESTSALQAESNGSTH